MMQPNWWDRQYGDEMAGCTAEQALQMLAKDKQLIVQLREALEEFDSQPDICGASRVQLIRTVVADILNRPDCVE